jgi:hypothetical protein
MVFVKGKVMGPEFRIETPVGRRISKPCGALPGVA